MRCEGDRLMILLLIGVLIIGLVGCMVNSLICWGDVVVGIIV